MKHPSHSDLSFNLAWQFTDILPGSFERAREAVAGKKFPILGPRPDAGPSTQPLSNRNVKGPYLYAVYSQTGEIRYVGKALEKTVLYRWIRPDKRTGQHYWSHGTTSGTKKATIEFIAEELLAGCKPVALYFAGYSQLVSLVQKRATAVGINSQEIAAIPAEQFAEQLENYLIYTLQPPWNSRGKTSPPNGILAKCGDYWK
ncbi:hypothetical protein [Methylomicrobium album]|uniref:GIY-YIG domain-containing protein n=1 Tax=Methylomicrobium album BG8 TaxID=686340 RepID=H8GIW0_METAL|nr:hypothetical protein [Methylomicrobium album]EIC30300.1 hypothetical protein Metal_2585 [Methylomicrobium album BG8]